MAKEIFAGVIGAILTAALLWFFGIIKIGGASLILPKHSVVSFNLQACPEGWKRYAQVPASSRR